MSSSDGRGIKIPTLEELLVLCTSKRPDLLFGVEIKEYTEETVDLTVALLKQYGVFERCYFYAFNGRIIRYIKEKYNGRTMGYPDFQMKEFAKDSYDWYEEIGLSMNLVKSEICPFYLKKGFPVNADAIRRAVLADHLCQKRGKKRQERTSKY